MTLTRRVLIVLPDAAHLMDVAGPAQVFVNASEVGGRYEVGYVGAAGRVQSHQGLAFAAPTDWPDLTPADLVLVPGWKTQTAAGFAPALLTRIREHWDAGGHVASICAGALALARTGVLAGHSATTHHDLIDELATSRDVSVMRDVLYTCEDRLHTSAGIASGIDLALHLVAHDHGPALAARVARTLVVPAWRAGAAPQASVISPTAITSATSPTAPRTSSTTPPSPRTPSTRWPGDSASADAPSHATSSPPPA